MAEEEKSLQEVLSLPILLADRLIKSAQDADSSNAKCAELAREATLLSQLLRTIFPLTNRSSIYDRPIRCITSDLTKTLDRALALVSRCHYKPNLVCHVLSTTATAEFRIVLSLLEESTSDVKWLLSIYYPDAGITANFSPAVRYGFITAMVWSFIVTVQVGNPQDRVDAAIVLACFACDIDRYRILIVEEKGIPPLVKLLKDGSSSPEAQIAAATALQHLANDEERVRTIANDLGAQFIVKVLAEAPMRVQISIANLVTGMAKRSLLNSRKITEKALPCLAKIIENEKGELQIKCLLTVMELAAVAEFNPELRRVAFKPSSPAAKAVLDQLLRVINEETSAQLVIPAIKAIGSLARTFPSKDKRIIEPIVAKLGDINTDVAVEACIALGKFACPDNFNRVEHSRAIVEFDGVPKLMNLLSNERDQFHELLLLCYLAIHVGNSEALEQARALSVLEGAARHGVDHQRPELKELVAKAIHHLTHHHAGGHTHP